MRALVYSAFLALLPVAAVAGSFESACGGSTFQVLIKNEGHPLENKYQLYGSSTERGERKLLYTADVGGWFYAECVASGDNRKLLLFQSFCGGSECAENKYGIIAPENLQLLLAPDAENKGNSKAASAILKIKRVPYLPRSKTTFCCDERPR